MITFETYDNFCSQTSPTQKGIYYVLFQVSSKNKNHTKFETTDDISTYMTCSRDDNYKVAIIVKTGTIEKTIEFTKQLNSGNEKHKQIRGIKSRAQQTIFNAYNYNYNIYLDLPTLFKVDPETSDKILQPNFIKIDI